MKNLRILSITVVDSATITALFTENINLNINKLNINLSSQTPGVEDPSILSTTINGNSLTITVQPLTPLAAYYIIFQSTNTVLFSSLNADSILPQDGVSNKQLILGVIEQDNPIRNFFDSFFNNNIYNLEGDSIISKYFDGISGVISKGLYDIGQVKNENYISVLISDEQKTRGSGPFDRLSEESAYEVIRVGRDPTGTNLSYNINYDNFPTDPISLLQTTISQDFSPSSSDNIGQFNINNLTLTSNLNNIIKLNSLLFIYSDGRNNYQYDIDGYGYQLRNSEYDSDFAFTYLLLSDNQIKLNNLILQDNNFSIENILKVTANFDYKDLGRSIDTTTLKLFKTILISRETLPPIENIFNLKKSPIVNSNGDIGTIGDIIFIDPNSLAQLNQNHPAFLYEIPFRLENTPSRPGEYSVDYSTGTVYVYGATLMADGTGAYPPLASYSYTYTFKEDADYSLEQDSLDVVQLPIGAIQNENVSITFLYEQTLSEGIDYLANIHQESLNENINNNLIALNVLTVENAPITDVFRIYNQTSGEIYKIVRWNNNKVYFSYINSPVIKDKIGERVSFQFVNNELLFISNQLESNVLNSSIFVCFLQNNNIISATEDCIGSSFNTSVKLLNNISNQEIYYSNALTQLENISKLNKIGNYQIDYRNGILYICLPSDTSSNLGSISYKRGYVNLQNPRIISVDDIYYQISLLNGKQSHFDYTNFGNGYVISSTFDYSNEYCLNGDLTLPYILLNDTIGVFENADFIPGVSKSISFIRSIYENDDLINNTNPINFASSSQFENTIITVEPLEYVQYENIQMNSSSQYFVNINTIVNYLSPNITISISVKRLSDNAELWDNSGTIITGSPTQLVFSGHNNPSAGQSVIISYSFIINDLSGLTIDYNRGEYYIDYSYLVDEIFVSYEYGDNNLDFRKNTSLSAGDKYYTTYKVGALRNALVKNFGSTIDIPILNSIDVDFERERYRDALKAAMQSFPEGPSLTSIKNIVENITHTPPQIIESSFQNWSLGNDLLNKQKIKTSNNLSIVPGKFDNGVLINQDRQEISFPVSSNLKLEEGTIQFWIIPQWNGIDNDAELKINIFKNNQPINNNLIFIGSGGNHPEIRLDGYSLFLNKNSVGSGKPNQSKNGVFIYYDLDSSGNFNRWYVDVIDNSNSNYKISINTDGTTYDSKKISSFSGDSLTTGTNYINFNINNSSSGMRSISFISDYKHYLFDFAEEVNKNRFSIFKDVSGYVVFQVIDKYGVISSVSSNISTWKNNSKHNIAVSWKLNTKIKRDELHLFIDGQEVPNLIRYGTTVNPYPNELFRTVNPEQIIHSSTKDIVGSNDLSTTINSNIVQSSINFSEFSINIGDLIFINELDFSTNGYKIININGNSLQLNTVMPMTINNGKYSVNQQEIILKTPASLYKRITVNTVNTTSNSNTELKGKSALQPDYSIGKDGYSNEILILSNNVFKDDLVFLNTYGADVKKIKQRYFSWGNYKNILTTRLPSPVSLDDVNITHIILPNTNINTSNVGQPIITAQPINSISGRTLSVSIISDNINFSTPTTVIIDGYKANSSLTLPVAIVETLTFNDIGEKNTVNLFTKINNIKVNCTPINSNKNYLVVDIKEQFPITFGQIIPSLPNNFIPTPKIRYSYQMSSGTTLSGAGNTVFDGYGFFSSRDVNNFLIIHSPNSVAGFYKILSVSKDHLSCTINTANQLPTFSNGSYEVLNTTSYRSGLQNGFFTFEEKTLPGIEYYLRQGLYEFEYYTYLNIPFDPVNQKAFIGTNYYGMYNANSIIDEFRIEDIALTDIRIGEVSQSNLEYITKNYNSLKQIKSNQNTLLNLSFDNYPFVDSSDYYINYSKNYIQTNTNINENFGKSILVTNTPIIQDNSGILNTKNSGTIEFWVNPLFDTGNDPNKRYYFDATGIITDDVISQNNLTVITSIKASKILSIKLKNGDDKVDYFLNGTISADGKTIILNKELPNQQTAVKVNYIPQGLNGDRLSIYKDIFGNLNFNVIANNVNYNLSTPIFWAQGTWHRIRAQYKFNSGLTDELRLFVDGYQTGSIVIANSMITPPSGFGIVSKIQWKDSINQFYIGSDFNQANNAFCLFDNLRISNINRPLYQPFGEPIDLNYNSNISSVFPVTKDLYTTLLINFDTLIYKNENFITLSNKNTGLFDFTINVFDSFGIISSNIKVKSTFETLIAALKPANSTVSINYIE